MIKFGYAFAEIISTLSNFNDSEIRQEAWQWAIMFWIIAVIQVVFQTLLPILLLTLSLDSLVPHIIDSKRLLEVLLEVFQVAELNFLQVLLLVRLLVSLLEVSLA